MRELLKFLSKEIFERIQAYYLYPLQVVFSCFRWKQAPREKQIRRYLTTHGIRLLRRRAIMMCLLGLLPYVFLFMLVALWQASSFEPVLSQGTGANTVNAQPEAGPMLENTILLLFSLPFLLTFGIVFMILSVFLSFSLLLGGPLLILVLVLQFLLKPAIRLPEVLAYLESDKARLKEESLHRLGQCQQFGFSPKFFLYPIAWPQPGLSASDLLWKTDGEQGIFGAYRFIALHFTDHYLGVYACDYRSESFPHLAQRPETRS